MARKTRPPGFVMWILSATMFVAVHSCARDQERVPETPRAEDPIEDTLGEDDPRTGLTALSDGVCFDDCSVVCAAGEEPTFYESGATIPCGRTFLRVSSDEHMEIRFTVTNENANMYDFDYGYQELLRYRDGLVIETLPLRQPEDPRWNETPFVRIRRQQYLADLDGDGHMEFAVVPYSPGSALTATARIYSLKDEIEPWGEGVLLIENDSFVRLHCMDCSRFSPEECERCR